MKVTGGEQVIKLMVRIVRVGRLPAGQMVRVTGTANKEEVCIVRSVVW